MVLLWEVALSDLLFIQRANKSAFVLEHQEINTVNYTEKKPNYLIVLFY